MKFKTFILVLITCLSFGFVLTNDRVINDELSVNITCSSYDTAQYIDVFKKLYVQVNSITCCDTTLPTFILSNSSKQPLTTIYGKADANYIKNVVINTRVLNDCLTLNK